MKLKYITFVSCVLLTVGMQAQNIDDVLRSVAKHNKELQAQQQIDEAAKLELQTRNNLEDPSVEYSPFFTRGISGMSSSELVVTQGFDFPTLYGARRSSNRLQQTAIEWQRQALRRTILLNAKELCFDLIRLNQQRALLEEQRKNADELLAFFEKRLKEGDTGILDVNKIKMECMNLQTEVAQNNAAHRTALQSLLALNGNMPLDFSADAYPHVENIADYNTLYEEVMATDATLQAADASVQAAEKEVKVSKQGWLPKLEVGYRRNTALDEKSNGFLVGGSFPLFSNRKKIQIARAQAIGMQLQRDNARIQAEAVVQGRYNEIQQLQEALKAYDVPLMHRTLSLLKQSVTAGQLSIIEYYVEAGSIYKNLQAYMDLECQYQKLMARIYQNRL